MTSCFVCATLNMGRKKSTGTEPRLLMQPAQCRTTGVKQTLMRPTDATCQMPYVEQTLDTTYSMSYSLRPAKFLRALLSAKQSRPSKLWCDLLNSIQFTPRKFWCDLLNVTRSPSSNFNAIYSFQTVYAKQVMRSIQ